MKFPIFPIDVRGNLISPMFKLGNAVSCTDLHGNEFRGMVVGMLWIVDGENSHWSYNIKESNGVESEGIDEAELRAE